MKKVLLVGYYGFGNIGDELMRNSVKLFLKDEGFEIHELLPKKEESTISYNRFNFLSVLKAIKKTDVVVCGGGGVLQDKTSFKSFIYYYTVFRTALLFNKPVIFFGNSFGPLKRKITRHLFKKLLKNEKLYIFARDMVSFKYASRYNKKIYLGTDPAIPVLRNIENEKNKNTKKAVIIPRRIRSYVPILLSLVKEGFEEVTFVPFAPEDLALSKRLSNFSVKNLRVGYCEVNEAIKNILESSLIISERFHGALIAGYFGIPFISIKDEKFRRFFKKYFNDSKVYAKDILDASYKISEITGFKIEVKQAMEKDVEDMFEKFRILLRNIV
ncbi:MAG: polysaccharide pyruvyl transferase family protein [Thermosipho sp. (in: Bacteria)]|nr:polysaccharide pyruvyl transferase family protein [Thermosipho sp. (in: thermotogales)]